jgi:hypothetical protein
MEGAWLIVGTRIPADAVVENAEDQQAVTEFHKVHTEFHREEDYSTYPLTPTGCWGIVNVKSALTQDS